MTARRRSGAALVAAALLLAAGCTQRNDFSATERHHPDAVNVDIGGLAVRHLQVLLMADPARAMVRASFVNEGDTPITLVAVTSTVTEQGHLDSGKNSLRLPITLHPDRVVRLQFDSDPQLVLEGVSPTAVAGTSLPITFHLESTGSTTVQVPVASAATT